MNVLTKAIKTSKTLALGTALIFSTMGMAEVEQDRRGGRGGQGEQEYQLKFNGQQFRGQNQIALKRELKQQFGHQLNLQQAQLKAVYLVAKSKQGRGQATLVVGHNQTYAQNVQGSPYDFNSERKFTYDRMVFQNPSHSSQGNWQIKLQGNIKVKQIIVVVKAKQQQKKVKLFVDEHFRGQNTLALKRMGKQQTNVDLQKFDLKAVVIEAKSKRGGGQATLVVGHQESYSQRISGSPRDFHYDAPFTFESVKLQNPSQSSAGKWQVQLQGNIKVKSVTLILEKKSDGGLIDGILRGI